MEQESAITLEWNVQQNLQYAELDEAYLAWAALNKKHLDNLYLLVKDQKELTATQKKAATSDKVQRDEIFAKFLDLFLKKLPEIWHQLTIDHSRTLAVDIAGVTMQYVSKLVDVAFEHKVHARVVGKKLEFFCSQDLTLQKADLSSIPADDLAMIGLTKPKSGSSDDEEDHDHQEEITADPSKITKEMIAEYSDFPDPIEKAEIVEILPTENKIKLKISQPDSYNSPLIAYIVTGTFETYAGMQGKIDTEVEITDQTLQLESLKDLKSLTLEFRAESKIGRQEIPFILHIQLAKMFEEIWMYGRNECNQIDYQLVDAEAKAAIDKHEGEDLFCDRWGKITFESLQIPDLKPASAVCKSTSLCMVNNSQLVQWGMSLSMEEGKVQEIPADMFVRSGILVKSISVGSTFCAASTIDGRVYTWGDNRVGQLGQGNFSPLVEHPTLVAALVGHFITDIKAGYGHSLCLSDKGIAFSWGMKQAIIGEPVVNRFGDHISFENTGVHQHTPQDISSRYIESGETVKEIASGEFHLGLLTNKGQLFLWGENENNMFGDYPNSSSVLPIRINLPGIVKAISLGFSHNIVEIAQEPEKDSLFLGWGSNEHFECGISSPKILKSPTRIDAFDKIKILKFSCGVDRTFIIDQNNDLFMIGMKFRGLSSKDTLTPVKIKERVKEVQELNGTIVALN
jgi:hypothetical protein